LKLDNYLIKESNKLTKAYPRKLGYIGLSLNILVILFGAFYIINKSSSWLWNIYGIIILITLFLNFILIYLEGRNLNEQSKLRKAIRLLGYIYLIIVVIAMFNMLIGNFTLSNSYSSNIKYNINLYYVIYFNYFIIFIVGGFIAYLNTLNYINNYSNDIQMKKWRIIKCILKFICYLFLCGGILVAFVILSKNYTWNIEIFISQFSIFYGFIFLSVTIMLLNLKNYKRGISYYMVALSGIGIFIVCILSLLATPYMIMNAEKSFNQVYGQSWRSKIDKNDKEYFLKTQFSIPAYFLGIDAKNFLVKKHILFYEGKDVDGKKIELYFDAYGPDSSKKSLPGIGYTIIRIHGGAWVAGDKGELNTLQMNKYLAEQGYRVFDIQYGLCNNSKFTIELGEPNYVKGNFKIDDMVNHIGIFTKYIENHEIEYGVNLEKVFLSGGSAGGHLAAAAGLSANNEKYKDIFSSKLKVKGLILYYPANGLPDLGNIQGDNKLISPQTLVQKNSPPCLIYQGTRDGLVPQDVSKEFRDMYYKKGNKNCTILWMTLGSHGSDCYFPGNYNQVFLYYMERFMQMNK
jgi:acetyl esterase/lipase